VEDRAGLGQQRVVSAWLCFWRGAFEWLSLSLPPEGALERPILTNPEIRGVTPKDHDLS